MSGFHSFNNIFGHFPKPLVRIYALKIFEMLIESIKINFVTCA